ncbi:TonB-dependent receptor [Sphingobium chlorophenolicum]|uniref:TonB-dependent receptor n=1 Tax=Sphingobium chlorophenolicum TaxID=46429 RepID=A0A081RF82_SPHCR|nr:TonB-dependent receptor [Sphingobium chlorophenolicum]KEQ53855.1 TonB-dependent receptor precursor [Sphingobium chlorophenolicum]
MKVHFKAATCIASLAIATAAYANDTNGSTSAAAIAPQDDAASGDIIVTAQRREESLQKTALAIEVLSGEALQSGGVKQFTDLTSMIPGVQVGSGGPAAQVYIRGVGDFGATAVSNPAVAFNVDGVYAARPQSVGGQFFDLARVEVLKGPQGTLYGRNASGGAINLIPNRPKLNQFGGDVQLSVQNYDGYSSEGALNIPLVDDVAALRFSYQVVTRDGYLSDGTNDDKHQSARLQLLVKPSDDVSVLLWGNYTHLGGKGMGQALLDPYGNPSQNRPPVSQTLGGYDAWTSITGSQANYLIGLANARYTSLLGPLPTGVNYLNPLTSAGIYQDIDMWSIHSEIAIKLGGVNLTIIPAYQKAILDYSIVPTFLAYTSKAPGYGTENSKTFSLETRLDGELGGLNWVVGAFYYHESQNQPSTASAGYLLNNFHSGRQTTEALAAFGQATYSVTDAIRLTGGLRYTDEKKDLTGSLHGIYYSSTCMTGSLYCHVQDYGGSTSVQRVDWKAGLEVDVADKSMAYLTVSTGFKSGGPQLADAAPYRPERLLAYELGLKNEFFGNKLQVNLEAFYWDYQDHQEQIIDFDDAGVVGPLIRNAGKAKSYGGAATIMFRPTRSDRFNFAVEYNETKYSSFIYRTPSRFLAPGSLGCAVTTPVPGISEVDCSGFQLAHAPKWSGSAGYTHSFHLANGATVDAAPNLSFASSRWISTSFIPNARDAGYVLLNADLTYSAPSNWSVSAFMRNITNNAVYPAGIPSPYVAGLIGANLSPPRTYGVRLNVKF